MCSKQRRQLIQHHNNNAPNSHSSTKPNIDYLCLVQYSIFFYTFLPSTYRLDLCISSSSSFKMSCCLLLQICLLAFASLLTTGSSQFHPSKAVFYRSPDCLGTPSGACGYGIHGRTINNALVTGVSGLWNNGTGCGACYQVRCKAADLCSAEGIMVVVTDSAAAGEAHFVLSPHAYGSMAYPSKTAELYSLGVVDVDYQRTPCRFPGYNLIFKVVEHSRFPHYLAIVPMFYGGEQDIHGVELQQEGGEKWVSMNKAWGAVWDLAVPPTGALKLRVKVRNANGEEKLIEANKGLPSSWKPGAGYDSHIQLY